MIFCLLLACCVEESEDEDDTRTTSGISFLGVRLVSLLVLGVCDEGAEDDLLSASRLLG